MWWIVKVTMVTMDYDWEIHNEEPNIVLIEVNELFPNVMIVFICYYEHLSVDLNCMPNTQ